MAWSFRKQMWVASGTALAISILGNIPLMGLPGALFMTIAQFGSSDTMFCGGDRAWPAAIETTFIFPWSIPFAVMLIGTINLWRTQNRLSPLPRGVGLFIGGIIVVGFGTLCAWNFCNQGV